MPTAVMFYQKNKAHTIYFSHVKAVLPVKLKNGETTLVHWGRRLHENSEMPLGGWAMQSAIHEGKWNYFSPKPVKLLIEKFMKIDYEGHSQWYEVTRGQWIQGILLQEGNECRVYIVIVIPDRLDVCYNQWPKIIIG
jgi:hypothetical protein